MGHLSSIEIIIIRLLLQTNVLGNYLMLQCSDLMTIVHTHYKMLFFFAGLEGSMQTPSKELYSWF